MIPKESKWFWIGNILLPLILGLGIYLLYRPDTYVSRAIYGLWHGSAVRPPIAPGKWGQRLTAFIRNYSCDMLWAYALTFSCALILGAEDRQLLLCAGICLLFELMTELLQKGQLLSGTFDLGDIALEFLTTAAAVMIIRGHRRYKKGRE